MKEIIANFMSSGKGREVVAIGVMVAVALGSFFLGRLSSGTSLAPRVVITQVNATSSTGTKVSPAVASVAVAAKTPPKVPAKISGAYVAAKTGTAYYLPWCGGVKRIKEENKVWFATKEEAERAGYHPAGNCKGI